MLNNFCDYCSCDNCKFGPKIGNTCHAKTKENKWICDCCFYYDVCTSGPNRNANGPCRQINCIHRPELISDWSK
jgi:hypothetical protein